MPRPITAAKKKDMMDLMPYIPSVYHNIYKNLSVIKGTRLKNQARQQQRCDNTENDVMAGEEYDDELICDDQN